MVSGGFDKMEPGDLVWYHSSEGKRFALLLIEHVRPELCPGDHYDCSFRVLAEKGIVWIQGKRLKPTHHEPIDGTS